MATKNIEIQDSTGNIYYPHTDASIVKFGDSNVNATLSDRVYQTAGGSATAITLTIKGTLVTGYPITFIASTNNGGAATTINGKKLYKPGTTTSPNLIAGKAYTVWYNSISDCFFIKASAEGTALAPDVRMNKTFSNDNDTGIVGGLDLSLLVPGNIRAGVTVDGVTGKSSVVDTADAVLDPQYLLTGYSGYDDGVKKNGTLTNRTSEVNFGGSGSTDFTDSASLCGGTTYNSYVGAFDLYIPRGYYSGTGTNRLHIPNLIPSNIVNGVQVGWNGKSITGAATIESLGGAKYYNGSFYRNGSFVTVKIGFQPDIIIYERTDGSCAGIRINLSWFYQDLFFSKRDYSTYYVQTGTSAAGASGNNVIINSDGFTFQATGGWGDTLNFIAFKL